jgi:hypothetical protein
MMCAGPRIFQCGFRNCLPVGNSAVARQFV